MLMMKPKLREYNQPHKLSDYPQATCFEAGHLVTKNAGWRNKKPIVSLEKCVGCLKCYMHCPDGVIIKENGKVKIDYDFCKGCGICVKECRLHAIKMEVEE